MRFKLDCQTPTYESGNQNKEHGQQNEFYLANFRCKLHYQSAFETETDTLSNLLIKMSSDLSRANSELIVKKSFIHT